MTGIDDGPPLPESLNQEVRAEGGYAYGALGADIHVFGDGTPLYLLFEHRQATSPDPQWLRAQPSRLLDARAEVVDFTGRYAELNELATWRDARPRFAVRWLHGEGGQGKTRLAAQLAADARRVGWMAVRASHRMDTHPPAAGSQDLRPDGRAGVLLLVDYADRWPVSDLSWLFQNRLLHQSVPTRVLLLARSAGGWPAIQGKLHKLQQDIDTSAQKLPPLPDVGGHRDDMFTTARDCFAQRYPEVTRPDAIAPPGPLRHPDFGLTLAVQMAALVAVDAEAHGRTAPANMVGLTAYLLNREHENWRQLYENAEAGLDFRTSDTVMARTVFTAILTGSTHLQAAQSVLNELMPGEPTERVLTDHASCYPPTDPAQANVLEPLLPDRLAEDFLSLLTPGHDIGSYEPDPWATTVPGRLLLDFTALLNTAVRGIVAALTDNDTNSVDPDRWRSGEPGQSAVASTGQRLSVAARAVTFLASATDRWPHVGTEVLYPLLKAQPNIAVAAGSGALTAIADIKDVPVEVLGAVEQALPDGRNTNLDVGAAEIVSALAARVFPLVDDPVDRADLHLEVSDRLASAGRPAEALEHSRNAVGISERLAAADRATHLPILARSVGTYALTLAELGRSAEAVVHTERTVALYEGLAETSPGERLSDLATAVTNHALQLVEVGRRAEALDVSRRAVALYEQLHATDPARHRDSLANALANHASLLGQAGFRAEAITLSERALEVREVLAAADRAAYLPGLAVSIHNHAVRLAEHGRQTEALACSERAVALREELVAANRAMYLPYLGTSLVNLAIRLAEAGRSGEALECSDRAVQAFEELAAAERAAHLAAFAKAITNHATRLAENDRHDEALACSERALHLQKELCAGNRVAHVPEWAAAMHNHAALLDRYGRHEEALICSEQAIQLSEEPAVDAEGPVRQLALAGTLYKHALRLGRAGQPAVALTFSQRALTLREELNDASDPSQQRELATWLHNHAVWLADSGRRAESFTVSERVVALRATLADPKPTAADAHLAESLSNHAIRLAERGRHAEAVVESERALRMYEELAAAHPLTCLPGLARALTNHGNRLATSGQREEALTCTERACELFESLVTTDRPTYLSEFAVVVHNQVARLLEVGRYTDAHVPSQRSVELCQELADSHAGERPSLARSLRTFAAVRAMSGADLEAAVPAGEQAMRLYREFAVTDPAFRTELSLAAEIVEAVASRLHWQLHLGYELEEIYCIYADSQVDITQDLPDNVVAHMKTRGSWVVGRLREINVESSLIELFERALDSLPTRENLPTKESLIAWAMRRRRIRRTLEHLLEATREAVGGNGARYYDCGVMLCRIRACATIVRAHSTPPTEVRADHGLAAEYRKELVRVSEVLEQFVTHASHTRRRDPEKQDLDLRLDNLAAYLASWRADGANLDDNFFEQVEDVTYSAGLGVSGQVERASTRPQR
ncbi:tetratricopeptide repeat protein [Amycolatopsis sp. WAC 01375]|uniref:tetratricopeptide repeat protein n=1 Tax=Amycolatopsis sp. WAC 01375 TaxID=2203194 RepID=UPI000F798543|nr:tetratricopeptide repeat protein [Amycolatopsis sp. WAC 01375]